MAELPKRIQRSRQRGWRMPEGAIYVGRPTKWGNPFNWRDCPVDAGPSGWARGAAADLYYEWLRHPARFPDKPSPPTIAEIRDELSGMTLCCWCPPNDPCHADILLALANGRDPTDA